MHEEAPGQMQGAVKNCPSQNAKPIICKTMELQKNVCDQKIKRKEEATTICVKKAL